MIPLDDWSGLLGREGGFRLPYPERERALSALLREGLVDAEWYHYVQCVHWGDSDQSDVVDPRCIGLVTLPREAEDSNEVVRCPHCRRSLHVSKKQIQRGVSVTHKLTACRSYVHSLLERRTGRPVREHPEGVFRVETRFDDVRIHLVDVASPFEYWPTPEALFVAAGDLQWLHRMPAGFPTFRLVDLVFGPFNAFDDALSARLGTDVPRLGPMHRFSSRANASHPRVVGVHEAEGSVGLSVPQTMRWKDIALYRIDGERLSVRLPGQTPKPYLYADLGFASRKSRNATKAWQILVALCEGGGTCAWRDLGYANFSAFSSAVTILRGHLRTLFGLAADPFAGCSQREGLRANFQAFSETPSYEHGGAPSHRAWTRISGGSVHGSAVKS